MMYLLLSFILSSVSLMSIAWFVYRQIEYKLRNFPPGPCGFPILGYAYSIRNDVHKSFLELNRKYGKICSTTALLRRLIIVGDYDTAKELLEHRAVLGRPPDMFSLVPGSGGFGGMNGPLWEQERKFMIHAIKNVGLGREVWEDIIQKVAAGLVLQISNSNSQPINIKEALVECAFQSMCGLIFGQHFMDKKNPDLRILITGQRTFKEHFRFSNPSALWPPILKYFIKFNINGYRHKDRRLKLFGVPIRKEILKRLNSDKYDPDTDLISSYLEHSLKEDSSEEAVNRAVNHMIGHISIYLTASDSSTAPTEWLMLLMAAYPEKQHRVHQEIDKVVGRSEKISWQDWRKFPYTIACIKEMIRWNAILPIFAPRWTTEEFEFQGYTIPENSVVFLNSWAMHHDPKYWSNPSEYKPERFLNSEQNALIKVEGYAAFSFGKRKCPGEHLSVMAFFLFFTGIMQKFIVKTPTGDPPDLTQHFRTLMEPTSQTLCFLER